MPSDGIRNSCDLVNAACGEIYQRWRRFLPATEATEQAEQFRQRFEIVVPASYRAEAALTIADRKRIAVRP